MGNGWCRKPHEIPRPNFDLSSIDQGDRAPGEDIEPFLLDHVGMISERVFAGWQPCDCDMRPLHAGEARQWRPQEARVRVEPLRERPQMLLDFLRRPEILLLFHHDCLLGSLPRIADTYGRELAPPGRYSPRLEAPASIRGARRHR